MSDWIYYRQTCDPPWLAFDCRMTQYTNYILYRNHKFVYIAISQLNYFFTIFHSDCQCVVQLFSCDKMHAKKLHVSWLKTNNDSINDAHFMSNRSTELCTASCMRPFLDNHASWITAGDESTWTSTESVFVFPIRSVALIQTFTESPSFLGTSSSISSVCNHKKYNMRHIDPLPI